MDTKSFEVKTIGDLLEANQDQQVERQRKQADKAPLFGVRNELDFILPCVLRSVAFIVFSTMAKSKVYTAERHSCFWKQRGVHKELGSCRFSIDTTLFPDIIVHFYSTCFTHFSTQDTSHVAENTSALVIVML
jgi:hypothetical protein